MSEIKLKPCPFCGGEALLESEADPTYAPTFYDPGCANASVVWWCKCVECGATVALQESEQNAAEAWNRRAGERDERD